VWNPLFRVRSRLRRIVGNHDVRRGARHEYERKQPLAGPLLPTRLQADGDRLDRQTHLLGFGKAAVQQHQQHGRKIRMLRIERQPMNISASLNTLFAALAVASVPLAGPSASDALPSPVPVTICGPAPLFVAMASNVVHPDASVQDLRDLSATTV